MRNEVTAILVKNPDGTGQIHFCSGVLQGSNYNIWFPINIKESIFSQVEHIMKISHIAHNVASIKHKGECENRRGGTYEDLVITYNEWNEEDAEAESRAKSR